MSQSVSCENTLLLSDLRQACANTQPHSYTQTAGLRLSLRGSNRASPLRALFKGLSCTVQRSCASTLVLQSACVLHLSLSPPPLCQSFTWRYDLSFFLSFECKVFTPAVAFIVWNLFSFFFLIRHCVKYIVKYFKCVLVWHVLKFWHLICRF